MNAFLTAYFTMTQQDEDDLDNTILTISDIVDALDKCGTDDDEKEILKRANIILMNIKKRRIGYAV